MKNFEKYENEISKLVNEDNILTCSIAIVSGMKKQNMCSSDDDCNECSKECLKWMHSEYKEQILTDDEKEIIKEICDVIHKFGCEVNYVRKNDDGNGKAYILLSYSNKLTGYSDGMTTPWFKNDKFKGMEIGRNYSLEELELENVNG